MTPRLALPAAWSRWRLATGGAAVAGLVLALAPGGLAPASLRAGAVVCALGAAAALARTGLARPAAPRRLSVVSRQALSRDAGVALLEVDGRSVLIGYGGPVQLLHGPPAPPGSPNEDPEGGP